MCRQKVIFLSLIFATTLAAQNGTNSPYSRFGYGRLVDPCFGKSQGLGGLSLSMRGNGNINPANPASYSAIDSMTFIFEVGVSGSLSHFSDIGSSKTTGNANLEYLAMQFPFTKWLGASLGLIPYSTVGYKFSSNDSIRIKNSEYATYTRDYSGTGGISQVYFGLSFNLWKRLALGANIYYLFGEINNNRSLTYSSASYTSSSYASILNVSSINLRYGIQYTEKFAKKHSLTLGLTYENRSKLNSTYKSILIGTDTVSTSTKSKKNEMPAFYGIGLSYTYDNRLTIGADYSMQTFAQAYYLGTADSLRNKSKVVIGAEYTHDPLGNRYIDRVRWRLGTNINNSYIIPNTIDFGISFGVGFPLKSAKTMLNVAFEYQKIGKAITKTIREDYFKFTFNATINETWFFKQKIR